MYSNTISLRYFFPRARILNEIAEFEKMPLNRKTLFRQEYVHVEKKYLNDIVLGYIIFAC